MAAHEVCLPRSTKPVFPNRCIRCDKTDPAKDLSLWTHTIGWWTWITLFWGWPVRVMVPACNSCRWRTRLYFWADGVLYWVVAIVLVFYMMPFLEPVMPRILLKYSIVLALVVSMIPYMVWQHYFPPPIDIHASSKEITYAFKDFDYAMEFMELNEESEGEI